MISLNVDLSVPPRERATSIIAPPDRRPVPRDEGAVILAAQLRSVRSSTGGAPVILFAPIEPVNSVRSLAEDTAYSLAELNGTRVLMMDLSGFAGERLSRVSSVAMGAGTESLSHLFEHFPMSAEPGSSSRVTLLSLSGEQAANPATIADASFLRSLEAARREYGFIVLHGPSLPGGQSSLLAASLSDVVVLGVHEKRGKVSTVKKVTARLEAMKASIFGFVSCR